jgi:hypothetical protein
MSKKFLELGQTPYSLNKALSLYVQELTIPVKGKKEVLFELKSPTDKQGGLYGVIFFESAPVQSNKSSTVQLIGRIGTIIYHEIGGSQKSSFELVYNKKETAIDKTNFYIDLINQGNVHVDLKGSLLILGANKEILDRVPISALKALPKTKQSFVLTSKRNFENKATSALLTLTYGDNQVYSKVFNLK